MAKLSRKVEALVGSSPPVSIEDFEAKLWSLAPVGNAENAFIHTCQTIGTRTFTGELITFLMIVEQRSRYVRSVFQRGGDNPMQWVKSLDRWLVDGGMNERYALASEQAKKRYGL